MRKQRLLLVGVGRRGNLLVRGVLRRVVDAGRLAEGRHAEGVPGAQEEGARGREQDVAVGAPRQLDVAD